MKQTKSKIDVTVQGEGPMTTAYLFILHTKAAKDWVKDNVESHTMFGGNLVVEHRFAGNIVAAMQSGGLKVA